MSCSAAYCPCAKPVDFPIDFWLGSEMPFLVYSYYYGHFKTKRDGGECMHTLRIDAQSYGRVFEIFPEERDNVELMIEDAVSLVLADLFEEAIVDDISVNF